MTKKMTITLENELIEEINNLAKKEGKKKTQIIREALFSHLNLSNLSDKQKNWKIENQEAINEYNNMIEKEGLILKESRMF